MWWQCLGLSLVSLVSLRIYFGNNASRMEYASSVKHGLCIGSGLAESSCKPIVTQRLKCSGMHLLPFGMDKMLEAKESLPHHFKVLHPKLAALE
jgi:hypothetical protein